MVVPPPLPDLRHPACRWQTVFAATAPLAGKSMQNAERCDIQATVSMQVGKFRRSSRVFFATPNNALGIREALMWSAGNRMSRYDAASILPPGAACPPAPFNVR
jgi:hypothetical protein